MHTYPALAIFALSLLAAGCANKPVAPFDQESMLPPPSGMQKFMGISDDHCEDEWEAYEQAWERAMEQVARFASTHVVSTIVDWARQETREVVLEKRILGVEDVRTFFDSEARLNTNVTLRQVYESQYYKQYRDGGWKAWVFVLVHEERLLADARKALEELAEDVESARRDAEHDVRMLKAQIQEKMQEIEAETLLTRRLEFLAEAREPYRQLQAAETYMQRARQFYTAGDHASAYMAYKETVKCIEDMPRDDSPVPQVYHYAYQQTWESIKDAIRMLELAQKHTEARKLTSAQKLLDEFHRRMGDEVGPFTHIVTGETALLSPLPALLGKQLDALRQQSQQASQQAESAATEGDVLNAMQAWHEALKANRENSQAQQWLDQAVGMFATAALEADPAELKITSHAAIKENLSVSLKTGDGQPLPMPIAFRFEESGVEAEMNTDLLNGVSSNGTLIIGKIRKVPADTSKLHLLATPAPQAIGNLDKALIVRLQVVLENHIISIPITLKPPSLAVLLNLTSTDVSEERMSQFRRSLEDGLRQKKYSIVEKSNANTMEVQAELRMNSAPVGSLVTLSLSIVLAIWHGDRALAENIELSSGAQVNESADGAFAVAQRIVIQKCVAEIERQMMEALVN